MPELKIPLGTIIGVSVLVAFYLILSFFSFPVVPGGYLHDFPADAISAELYSIFSKGYAIAMPEYLHFNAGDVYRSRDIIAQLPIDPVDLKFNCPKIDVVCSSDKLDVGAYPSTSPYGQVLRVNSMTYAYMAVCGDNAKNQSPKYCVGFGSTAANATNACIDSSLGGCGIAP